MKSFAVRYHKLFVVIFIASVSLYIAGCGGTFFSEAPGVIQAVIASVAAISAALSFVPGIGTAAEAISGVLQIADQEFQEIETLIQQYKTNPDESTLQKIEAAIQLGITNLQKLLAPVGLPAALAQKIGSIAQVALDQFEAWAALISGLKVKADGSTTVANAAAVSAAIPKLLSAKAYRDKVNSIMETPTGDPVTDQAFASVSRL